jgi:hypothetical protein
MHGRLETAAKLLVAYEVCDLTELQDKKAVNVLDKISKFIKLSRYYGEWNAFREKIKNNKAFDQELKGHISILHGPGLKIMTRKGRIPKLTAEVREELEARDARVAETPKHREEQLALVKKRVTVTIKRRE